MSETLDAMYQFQVPWDWEEVICTCPSPEYYPWYYKNPAEAVALDPNIRWICKRCEKWARFVLQPCKGCGQRYMWNFVHHANFRGKHHDEDGWARHKQLCWNCITKKDPALPGDIPPEYTESPRKPRSLEEIDLGGLSFDSFDF